MVAHINLNWMNAPNNVRELGEEDELTWIVATEGQQLTIQIHEILSDVAHGCGR